MHTPLLPKLPGWGERHGTSQPSPSYLGTKISVGRPWFFNSIKQSGIPKPPPETEKIDVQLLVAPWLEPAGRPLRRTAAHVQGVLQGRRGALPRRPRRRPCSRPHRPRRREPALVQGHARQPAGQGQGGRVRLLPRQQGHWPSRPALPPPVPSGNPLPFLLLCTALFALCEILDL